VTAVTPTAQVALFVGTTLFLSMLPLDSIRHKFQQ